MTAIVSVPLVALFASLSALALGAAVAMGWRPGQMRDHLLTAFVTVLIILGLLSAAGQGGVDQSSGDTLRQALTGSLYLAAAWVFMFDRQANLRPAWDLIPPALVLIPAVAMLSTLWSIEPEVTFRRSIQLIGVVLLALAIVRSLPSQTLWRNFTLTYLAGLVVALVIALILPDFAFDTEGNFRGLSEHKNSWAGVALSAAIPAAWLVSRDPRSKWLWFALLLSLFSIALTKSATATSVAAVAVGIVTLSAIALSGRRWLLATLLSAALVVISLPLLWLLFTGTSPISAATDAYLAIVQKESSLTGRDVLWQTVLNHAWESPIAGVGYGAFWLGDFGPAIAVVSGLDWIPVHSHNGYIDLFNELGLLGCSALALTILVHGFNLLRLIWLGNGSSAVLHSAITVSVLAYNLAESSLLLATHALWVMLVLSVVDAHRLAWSNNSIKRAA